MILGLAMRYVSDWPSHSCAVTSGSLQFYESLNRQTYYEMPQAACIMDSSADFASHVAARAAVESFAGFVSFVYSFILPTSLPYLPRISWNQCRPAEGQNP